MLLCGNSKKFFCIAVEDFFLFLRREIQLHEVGKRLFLSCGRIIACPKDTIYSVRSNDPFDLQRIKK